MPSLVVLIVEYVTASDKCVYHKLTYVVWPWIEAVGLTSSAINPWIYVFRNGVSRSFAPLLSLVSFEHTTGNRECEARGSRALKTSQTADSCI